MGKLEANLAIVFEFGANKLDAMEKATAVKNLTSHPISCSARVGLSESGTKVVGVAIGHEAS